MINPGYRFYQLYGYYIVGIKVRGTIGNPNKTKYQLLHHPTWHIHIPKNGSITYQLIHNRQIAYPYRYTLNKKTPAQVAQQEKLRHGVLAWQALPEATRQHYRNTESRHTIKEGFCYFLSKYIKSM